MVEPFILGYKIPLILILKYRCFKSQMIHAYIYKYIYLLEFTVATLPNSSPPLALRGGVGVRPVWVKPRILHAEKCVTKCFSKLWPLFDLFLPPWTFFDLQNDTAYDTMGYHTVMYVKNYFSKYISKYWPLFTNSI